MAILTNLRAKSIAPDAHPLPHGGVEGLSLHPSRSEKGHGKWVFRYTSPVTGKRRLAGLGPYPTVGIAEAAKRAIAMREDLTKGIDPLEEKKIEKLKERPPTFAEAAERVYIELKDGWANPKHQQQWINTIRQYAVPCIGGFTLDQL